MAELRYDPRNYRIHTDKNKRLIKKSLEDCGTGRSILLDKNDVIIAGNGVYEQHGYRYKSDWQRILL